MWDAERLAAGIDDNRIQNYSESKRIFVGTLYRYLKDDFVMPEDFKPVRYENAQRDAFIASARENVDTDTLKFFLRLEYSDKTHDGYGFKSKKTSYAAGELVTVYYDLIGTDTDYYFYTDSDDVELERDYNDKDGYIFKFRMPAHDVVLSVDSRNSMEYIPDEDNE